MLKVGFIRGGTWADFLIRCWQGDPFDGISHSCLLNGNEKIEAIAGAGVRKTFRLDYPGRSDLVICNISGMDEKRSRDAWAMAESYIGLKYDWLGVFGILGGFRLEDPGRMFCSELVETVLRSVGIPLTDPTKHPWQAKPWEQFRSPWLSVDTIIKGR